MQDETNLRHEVGERGEGGESGDSDRWLDWPCCPECGQRRQTLCPICELADDEFPLAEFIPAAESVGGETEPEPERAEHPPTCCGAAACGSEPAREPGGTTRDAGDMLLLCSACDEAFTPKFYRFCAGCGFDFGSGIEVPSVQRDDEFNTRTLVAILLTLGLMTAVLGYFWWLFAQ